jgi:hypothetical protein
MLVIRELEFDMFNDPRSDHDHTLAEFVDRVLELAPKGEIKALSNTRIQIKTPLSTYIFFPQIYR